MSDWQVPNCVVCRDSGWASFDRAAGKTPTRRPWAAACLCEAGAKVAIDREWDEKSVRNGATGRPVVAESIDRSLFFDKRTEIGQPNHANSTLARRLGAVRYIVRSFQRDPEPIHMVEAILAGQRDDVVRAMESN